MGFRSAAAGVVPTCGGRGGEVNRGAASAVLEDGVYYALHSDHTRGLPEVVFSPRVLRRMEPVEIYGPRGLHAMMHISVWRYGADGCIGEGMPRMNLCYLGPVGEGAAA